MKLKQELVEVELILTTLCPDSWLMHKIHNQESVSVKIN